MENIEKEILDLELSFEEIKKLPIAKYLILPINSDLKKYKSEIEKLKFPCWIKLNTGEHKLKLNALSQVFDFEDLEKTYKKFKKQFPDKKFIIQENVKGLEIIAGIKQDSTFGKVLLLGTGGTLTEIIKDTEFRVLPITEEEISEALKQLKIFKILLEKNYQIKKLIKLILNFSELEISEADLNPIIINEKEVKVVDARVFI